MPYAIEEEFGWSYQSGIETFEDAERQARLMCRETRNSFLIISYGDYPKHVATIRRDSLDRVWTDFTGEETSI